MQNSTLLPGESSSRPQSDQCFHSIPHRQNAIPSPSRLPEGRSATNRMLIAHLPPIPRHIAYLQRNLPASMGGAHIASRIRHVGPPKGAYLFQSLCECELPMGHKKKRRERKEEKYNPRYRKHCANICFKISSTCQRQAATGEMAERENSGKRGSTEARKNGKLRQVRSVGIFICPGSLSTQFDLISARFIYLWFFSLQRSKRTEARKNEI